MKKILGGILLVIVLWLASIAVIGTKTKDELEKIIEKSNKQYATHGLKLNIVEYQKSFFDATAKLEVEILDAELKEVISESYGLAFPLVTEYQIEHGPLFFKNGIGVGLSRVYQEVEISSLFNKEVQDKFTKKSMIASKTVVSFSKVANYNILSESIEMEEDTQKIDIAPFEISGENHMETFAGEMQIVLPFISFVESDKKLIVESMLMDIKMDKLLSKSLVMGIINLSMKNFHLSDNSGVMEIEPTFHIVSQKDGEKTFSSTIEMDIDFKDTTTKEPLSELKKLTLQIKIDGLGIKGMQQYQEAIKKVEQKQATIMIDLQKNPESSEENYQKLVELQQEIATTLFNSLKDMLFKDKTAINYTFNMQTKDKKESHGDILLGYTGDIDFSKTPQEISQKVASDIFSLFKLELDMRVAESHIKTLPDGEERLKQLQLPMTQTMVKYQNQHYSIKGHLKNRELILNDDNLTTTVLPLLKMLTQMGVAQQ